MVEFFPFVVFSTGGSVNNVATPSRFNPSPLMCLRKLPELGLKRTSLKKSLSLLFGNIVCKAVAGGGGGFFSDSKTMRLLL